MPITIEMPKLSDTMTEGTLLRWVKKVGDAVAVGDVLAEVETDKATMEMEAFDDGTLSELYVNEGQTVQVGQKLALLVGEGEAKPSVPTSKQPAVQKTPNPEKNTAQTKQTEATPADQSQKPAPAAPAEKPSEAGIRVKASPLARKVAADLGVRAREAPWLRSWRSDCPRRCPFGTRNPFNGCAAALKVGCAQCRPGANIITGFSNFIKRYVADHCRSFVRS